MYLDAIDLKEFYKSRLGRRTREKLNTKIQHVWPNVSGDRVLGIGYATPYLRRDLSESERVFAFMPATQGVFRWPREGPSISSLVLDNALPLPDSAVDKVMLIHSLEMTDNPRDLLDEVWRVLTPGGRLLVIVPNRTGLWARLENTPFGYGRPFSRSQLSKLMRDQRFSPIGWVSALHTPPIERRSMLSSKWVERSGERFWSGFSGVFLMEAKKELFQGVAAKVRSSFAPSFKPILVPAPQPSPQVQRRAGCEEA
ncbi:MAG: methyltransferase domain-containing protein [Pseudomonadota bacterium]